MRTDRIVITAGEPAGIGPDLCVQIARQPSAVERVVAADRELLESRAQQLGLSVELSNYHSGQSARPQSAGQLKLLPVTLSAPAIPGQLNATNAGYVLDTLRMAVQGCISGEFAALVTAPVHKRIINEAGIPFTGHTEFLARMTGTKNVVMMLATSDLRVALATTHLPISKVSQAITAPHLEQILRILNREMGRYFCTGSPRILVCGINPHAGEGGYVGREEIEIIQPVLEKLRGEGMQLRGPLPADTLFTPNYLDNADVVLAMYHDQGLPVLKFKGFGQAANITLGLPIIRTSVDHGTALELAGSGKAASGSLEFALRTALEMHRKHSQ